MIFPKTTNQNKWRNAVPAECNLCCTFICWHFAQKWQWQYAAGQQDSDLHLQLPSKKYETHIINKIELNYWTHFENSKKLHPFFFSFTLCDHCMINKIRMPAKICYRSKIKYPLTLQAAGGPYGHTRAQIFFKIPCLTQGHRCNNIQYVANRCFISRVCTLHQITPE